LSAVALVAALLSASGALLAAADRHPVCVAKDHDCGTAPTVGSCCCGDEAADRDDGTLAQPRVEVRVDLAATPEPPHVVHIAPAPQALSPVRTSPPRLCLLDLPTLFATFLI